jgi:hypothetical protein
MRSKRRNDPMLTQPVRGGLKPDLKPHDTLAIPEMITLNLSAGAGVGSFQKGILRVIGSGPRYADVMG